MNLNVRAPIVKLIGVIGETTNSCISYFTFSITTAPGNSVTIDLVKEGGNPNGYDSATIGISGGNPYASIVSGTSYTLPEGTANIGITIGNTGTSELTCNGTIITVTDSALPLSEEKTIRRCNNYSRC